MQGGRWVEESLVDETAVEEGKRRKWRWERRTVIGEIRREGPSEERQGRSRERERVGQAGPEAGRKRARGVRNAKEEDRAKAKGIGRQPYEEREEEGSA